ncbi:MAG: hypothetical protein WKF52_09780 [Sphingomicrobium sp.]
MARLDFNLCAMMLEAHPSKPDEAPEPRVLSPMSDGLATLVGHILVSWGQMMDSMLRYTKCLIAHNGSDSIQQKWLDYPKLELRLEEECDKAFAGTKLPAQLAKDALRRASNAKLIRKHLAHDPISWASEANLPVVVVSIQTKTGGWRTSILRLKRLETARLNIEIAHGRIHQLALSSAAQVPYSSPERSLLQEIQAKGWTPHPIVGKP